MCVPTVLVYVYIYSECMYLCVDYCHLSARTSGYKKKNTYCIEYQDDNMYLQILMRDLDISIISGWIWVRMNMSIFSTPSMGEFWVVDSHKQV